MRCALAVAAFLALAAPAATAAPRGAPERLGSARASDHRAHPSASSEWWIVRLVDPRSPAWLEIEVQRDPERRGVELMGRVEGAPVWESYTTPDISARTGALDAGGLEGGIQVRRGGRVVRLAAPEVTGTVRLRASRGGPAAYRWRLGMAPRPDETGWRPVTLNWSMPIATATTSGTLQLGDGRRLRLSGWRASYEHGWGDILNRDPWNHWDQVVVHGPRGTAWVAYGLNRNDTVPGPGARDAQWLGLLARVSRRGLRVCRPRVDRRVWSHPWQQWAERMAFRCGDLRLRVRDRRMRLDEREYHVELRGRTAGQLGFSAHLARQPAGA